MATQTLTFLFTDIEGSTAMLLRLGDAYAQVLAETAVGLVGLDVHRAARIASAAHGAFALDLEGDRAGAARDAAESLQLYRQVGDQRQVGTMLGNLGYVELSIGDIDIARGHLLESLDMARELNDHYGVVYETFNLGLASYLSGSLDAAADLFVESLHLAKRMQMKQSIAYALIGVAMAGSGADGMSRSVRLHGAAEQALTVLGETIEPLESGLRDRDCGRHHQWWSLCGGTRGEGTVWRGFPAVRSRRPVKLTRAGRERRVVRGGYGLRGPADRQTRGNHQGSPWGDAAVELLSVIPDTTSRRRQ